jgi:uncharacterized protein with ATP-grasp and redox domains
MIGSQIKHFDKLSNILDKHEIPMEDVSFVMDSAVRKSISLEFKDELSLSENSHLTHFTEKLYTLNNDYLSAHYNDFMCSYGDVNISGIISRNEFTPETFFVKQKQNDEELLFFRDVSFRDWVFNMITDIINHIDISHNKAVVSEVIYQNVLYLLEYKDSASEIANQEFVDIIRRIVAYTLTGDVCSEIHTAKNFNSLASKFLPLVIKRFRNSNFSTQTLLKYSIISGVSGLDLKGAPAAASAYANEGIKMQDYASVDAKTAAEMYTSSLNDIFAQAQSTIFDWDEFVQLLKEKKKLIWMTDDFIESHFDLLVIASLLQNFDINVEVIPKNGFHGNDLSYSDLMKLLSSGLFPELQTYLLNGRLTISQFGPKMGAANIRKLSPECVSSIQKAGLLFAKGCRISEMLQGGLSVNFFSSFYVVRKLSEITSGFLAEKNEAIFLHLVPKEYAFFGVDYANSRKEKINENRFCVSTSVDHKRRKSMIDIEEIKSEHSRLQSIKDSYTGDKFPLYQEMNMLAQKIKQHTRK